MKIIKLLFNSIENSFNNFIGPKNIAIVCTTIFITIALINTITYLLLPIDYFNTLFCGLIGIYIGILIAAINSYCEGAK